MKIKNSVLLLSVLSLLLIHVPNAFARHGHDDAYDRKHRRHAKVVRHHYESVCHKPSWEDRYEHNDHRRRDNWRIGIILPVPIVIKIY